MAVRDLRCRVVISSELASSGVRCKKCGGANASLQLAVADRRVPAAADPGRLLVVANANVIRTPWTRVPAMCTRKGTWPMVEVGVPWVVTRLH